MRWKNTTLTVRIMISFSNIFEERGLQHFVHEYVSTSLIISNFITSKGELLASTTSGYDQNMQAANTNKLFSVIDGLTPD